MNVRISSLAALASLCCVFAAPSAFAQALSLEDFCDASRNGIDWDPVTSTCTVDGTILWTSVEQVLAIQPHETLQYFNASEIIFLGIVFNAGTIIVDHTDAHFSSLVNSGELRITEDQSLVLLGTLLGIPNVNTGIIENGNRLVTATRMDNVGHVVNDGLWENYTVFENRGYVDNSGGTANNYPGSVINNYRCPGSTGVVTAGAGNIVNEGTIQFITGKDC